MKNFFQKLSIRGKLLAGFGVIVMIMLISGVIELYTLDNLNKERITSATTVETTRGLIEVGFIMNAELGVVEVIANTQDDQELKQWEEKHSINKEKSIKLIKQLELNTRPQKGYKYNTENKNINDTLLIVKNIYQRILPTIEQIIEKKQELLDPSFLDKNIELSLPEDTASGFDTIPDVKLSDDEKKQVVINEIKSYQKQVKKQLKQLSLMLNLASKVSLGIEKNTELTTTIFYKNKANEFFLYTITLIVIAIFVALLISRSILKPIEELQHLLDELTSGNLPEEIETKTQDELGDIGKSLNMLSAGLRRTAEFSTEIGKGNFESSYSTLGSNDILGNSLLTMRDSLKAATESENKRKVEERQRDRSNQGQTKFANILRHNNENINELSSEIISNLVKFLNANQGGIFILNDDDKDNIYLELLGAYAYNRKKYLAKKVHLGEGLVGAVAVEKYTIHMTDIPNEYIEIESGTGSSNPKSLLIVPLKIEDDILGVIELASFNEFEDYEIELTEKIAESIASTLSTSRINTRTAKLLKKSEQQAELMKEQEEEMLQNIEELKATQEGSNKREKQLRKTLADLKQTQSLLEKKDKKLKQELELLNKEHQSKLKELLKTEVYSNTILESSINATVIFDKESKIELFNNAAQVLWGYKRSEIIGRHAELLFPGNIASLFREDAGEFSFEESNMLNKTTEIQIVNKKEKKIYTMLSLSKITLDTEVKYVAFLKDISKEKQLDIERTTIMEKLMASEFEAKVRIEKLTQTLLTNKLPIPEASRQLLSWSSEYSIGLTIIDQQHKKWFEIINRFYDAFKEGKAEAELLKVTSELLDYTDYHFSFEEKYMQDFKYNDYEAHQKGHKVLIDTITQFQEKFKEGEVGIPYKLMNLLRKWVRIHVLEEDIAYVPVFKKNGLT